VKLSPILYSSIIVFSYFNYFNNYSDIIIMSDRSTSPTAETASSIAKKKTPQRTERSGLSRADGIQGLKLAERIDHVEAAEAQRLQQEEYQRHLAAEQQRALQQGQALQQQQQQMQQQALQQQALQQQQMQQQQQQMQQQAQQQLQQQQMQQQQAQQQAGNIVAPVLNALDAAVHNLRAPTGTVPPDGVRCTAMIDTSRGQERCRKKRTPHIPNCQFCSTHAWMVKNGAANKQTKQAKLAAFFLNSQLKRSEKLQKERAGINRFLDAAAEREQEINQLATANNQAGDSVARIQQLLAKFFQ